MSHWGPAVWASATLVIACLVGVILALGGIPRMLRARRAEPTREWFESFDFTRYEALLQLLAPDDFNFLRSQPGYTPELAARLKADRLAIAQSYLDELQTNVCLLLKYANRASAHAAADGDNFSAFLLMQEFRFTVTVARLRCELGLMRLGVDRQIEFQKLLDTVRPIVQLSQMFSMQPA
jgi:hypothetical protein